MNRPFKNKYAKSLIRSLQPSMPVMTADDKDTIALICDAASRLQQLAVHACNRELTPKEESEDERLEKRIRELVAMLPKVKDPAGEPKSIRVKTSGDPRGAVVKLVMPDGRYDSMGGPTDGICVPTPNW